jgi:predicted dehydrogenase
LLVYLGKILHDARFITFKAWPVVHWRTIQMNSNKNILRVGIAGQGRSGYHIHTESLRHIADQYRITAVADQLLERCREAEQEFGARAYADYREMIRQGGFDLFVNALPSPLHVPATLEALQAGYHVLCEKPMAGNVAEFDRMTAAAAAAGRVLAPFQNNRFQPFFMKMQEVLASGVLGKIVYIRSDWGHYARRWDWQTFQCNLGGALFNTGPHAVDQVLTLMGGEVMPQVFCRMYCHNTLGGDADDLCALTLSGKDLPLAEINLSAYLAYPHQDMYAVSGAWGGMNASYDEVRWKYYDPGQAPKQAIWKPWSHDRNYPSEKLAWVEHRWSLDAAAAALPAVGYTLKSYLVGAIKLYTNLHEVVLGGAQLIVSLAQVRRQIAVIEECQRQNPLPVKKEQWL